MNDEIGKYTKKAKILTKYFGVYGNGNFDLSTEEVATILEFVCVEEIHQYFEIKIKEFYERLEKTRLG